LALSVDEDGPAFVVVLVLNVSLGDDVMMREEM
jgi:hypothetical protein